MTIIFSDNNSRILTAPLSDPLEGGRGGNCPKLLSLHFLGKSDDNKNATFPKVLFFLCFRPTIKFQDGSLVNPLSEPSADPLFDSTSEKLFYRHFGGFCRRKERRTFEEVHEERRK